MTTLVLTLVATLPDGAQLSASGEGGTLELAYCVAVQRLSAMLGDAGVEAELFEANGRYHRWDALAKAWVPVNDAELESIAVKSSLEARIAAARAMVEQADHDENCAALDQITTIGQKLGKAQPCDCGLEALLATLDGRGPNG